MTQPDSLQPGWYPDPSNPERNLYWDGRAWKTPTDKSDLTKDKAVAVAVCVLAAIGLFMSMQSVSLLSGTGSLWLGVAVAGAATAVAFLMRGAKWVRIVAVVALTLSLANVLYMEHQVNEKRKEISELFNQ